MQMKPQTPQRCFIMVTLLAALLGNRCGTGNEDGTLPVEGIYYVALNGDDQNPGTEAQPWRTIQKAAATLVAGDTVFIKTGTYAERVEPKNSGSEGHYITYAAKPGNTVILDGTSVNLPEWAGLVDLSEKSYIRISGLRIMNSGPTLHNPGINADTTDHVIIEKNYVFHTSDAGILVWSSRETVVADNEVEQPCYNGYNEGISVGESEEFEITGNLVHDSQKEGICAKDGSANGKIAANEVCNTAAVGIYVDAQDKRTHDIEVYGNIVHDTATNGFALASEQGGLLENVRVFNNVGYANRWTGLQVTACCISSHPLANIQIVNNTFYHNGQPPWGGGILLENTQAVGVVIRNNICSQNLTFQIAVDSGVAAANVTVDHNLIDGFRDGEDEIRGLDSVSGDPRFVNPSGGDFHLQSDSPAIDRGSADGAPAIDFDGQGRPVGMGYDIGADEYASAALLGPLFNRTFRRHKT